MVGYSNIINNKSSTTIPKDSFVAPSPSCNHSMLHQTFYPPLFRYPKSLNPFSATSSLLPPPPPPPSSLPEVERNPSSMEAGAAAAALQETRLPAAPPALEELEPELVLPDDVDWAVEHATMMDEFLVDDLLLDFDETEVEETKQEDTPTAAVTPSATTAEIFEPAPLSDMDLWSHNPEEFEWMSSIIDESMAEYPPVPTFIPTTQNWLPAVKRAKRTEGLRIPCSSWPCPFTKSDSSGSSNTTVSTSSSSSSQYNNHHLFKYGSYQFDQQLSKKRGRKPKNHQLPRPAMPAAAGRAGGSSYGERSCTHCGSQKTPQWRLGPMGPKTLCNACGVRYKSGRLVPEYRPAASPTFIPQVHSSSHRKVMEMRRQKEMEAAAPPPRAASC